MQLYFVRHGESQANITQVFSNRDPDNGLTERGRAQVEQLADRLTGVPFGAFYCSPMLRAQQSAEILSARLGIDYVTTNALAEYDVGELEGRSDAASWQRYYALIDVWFRDRDWTARIEGGESFDDIRARFLPFIDGLLESPEPGPGCAVERRETASRPARSTFVTSSWTCSRETRVLLLGHGGTFRCMLPLILSNVTFDFAVQHAFDNSSVVIAEQGPDGLVCVRWKGRPIADWA